MKLRKVKGEKFGAMVGEMNHSEKVYYPTVELDSDEMPEVKDWNVGESYKVVLEIKQTSSREDDNGKITANFEIRGIMPISDDEADELTDDATYVRARSGKAS